MSLRRAFLAIAALALVAVPLSASAEIVQRQGVRLAVTGSFTPRALPRSGAAPIAVAVGGTIATADGSAPPQLRGIEISVNRNARFDFAGLPTCAFSQLQPTTTAGATAACGSARVGEGTFAANVAIPEQSPFPARGKIVAFNGLEGGRHVILAHIYGTEPVPTSYTLPLRIVPGHGTYGTVLRASLPELSANIAFVTAISLRLHRSFRYRGKPRGYLSAGCPAPAGFPGASFPLARASFSFAGGLRLGSTLVRDCKAKG